MTPVLVFCLIAALGIGAQWLAWRWKVPAIVLLLLSGVLVFVQPESAGQIVFAMFVAALSLLLYREVKPYAEQSDNVLFGVLDARATPGSIPGAAGQ